MNSLATSSSRLGQSLRLLRERAGLSIGALARETGLSKTSISNIEIGKSNPSLETMWRLANALRVTLGTLVGDDSPSMPHVIRSGDVPDFTSASGGLHARILSVAHREHRTELLELIFDKEVDHHSNGHGPGTEEFLICTQGDIEAGPEGEAVRLREGDAMWFSADCPHEYRTTRPGRAILMMVYPAVTTAILGRTPTGPITHPSSWRRSSRTGVNS
jgi:transcriptional regulator with XRE-family HTH domain